MNTDEEDLISIVVPVYNAQDYVGMCLDSIINQTYHHLQIIIVNDGSTDHSEKICESYRRQDSRIEYVYQKNKGPSAARNEGILYAKGKYICFVDSDDYIHKQYVEKLYYALKYTDADMSMCSYIREGNLDNVELSQSDFNVYSGKEMMRRFFSFDVMCMNIVANKLYKTEVFLHDKFPEGMFYEDFALNARLMYTSDKIVFYNQPLYFYRRTANSTTLSSFSVRQLDALKQIENRMLYFKDNGEAGIYGRFLQEYEVMNLKFYYLCKTNDIPDKRTICIELRQKFKFYFKKTITAKENRLLKKIYIGFGYIFPFFMGYVTNFLIKEI